QIWNEANDNHPPTYYLLLHHWLKIGREESWLRLPSVYVSMISLALTYTLGRSLFSRKAGLTAAAFLAVAPLSIWYAQEARMVIFVVPFALMIALGFFWEGWRGRLLLFVGLAGGLYFDYTIVPLWVILSALWLVKWGESGRSPGRLMR